MHYLENYEEYYEVMKWFDFLPDERSCDSDDSVVMIGGLLECVPIEGVLLCIVDLENGYNRLVDGGDDEESEVPNEPVIPVEATE